MSRQPGDPAANHSSGPIADAALDTILAETIAIWAAYDVAVCPVLTLSRPDDDRGQEWIKLVIRNAPANRIDGRTPRGNRALASILFVDAVTPGDTMYASLDAARQEVEAAEVEHFPPVVQERLAAQLLGRAIAHELGHYLLGSTKHSSKGLMRASLGGTDLLTPDAGAFRLEAEQAATLATRMHSTSRRAASSPGGRSNHHRDQPWIPGAQAVEWPHAVPVQTIDPRRAQNRGCTR